MYDFWRKFLICYFNLNTSQGCEESEQTNKQTNKQDMTVPFARARAKLGGSIR